MLILKLNLIEILYLIFSRLKISFKKQIIEIQNNILNIVVYNCMIFFI
jgi:hypothetical protein